MDEIWLKLLDSDKPYYISNFGRFKSERLIHKQRDNGNGYLRVDYISNNKSKKMYVHRLVAMYFLPKLISSYNEVNHIDGNKKNNHVSNLEWCDKSINNKHAYAIGLRKSNLKHFKGINCHKNKKIIVFNTNILYGC